MVSQPLTFSSRAEHRAWLEAQAALPEGFRAGTTTFEFVPLEVPRLARMNLTLLALDRPTPAFAAKFTRNAFPGAPVIIGRQRLDGAALGAIIVNNKISNACAPGGVDAAEGICADVARHLGIDPHEVLPSSTGVIGWRLPVEQMKEALPAAVASLQRRTAMPAAEAIRTTDLYPKIRRVQVGEGSILGIAKGAGMIEPNLATLLVFLLTDVDVPRAVLRQSLDDAVESSFNNISVDSDTSTSDTVVLVSSRRRRPAPREFPDALAQVCRALAEDVVRNGEGVHHVLRVRVQGAPSFEVARSMGKAVVNSPLVKTAINGNDPNVGRLLCAVGKHAGAHALQVDAARTVVRLGGEVVLEGGAMRLDPAKEERLAAHLREAEMYRSVPDPDGSFRPPIDFPPHERRVEIEIDLGMGAGTCAVLGGDLSHEYVSENADYRS